MLFNALEHVLMLLLIACDLSVEVGNKLHGAFGSIIHGREAVDQLPEVGIVFPFNGRF